MTTKMFNVRIEDELWETIDKAAADVGVTRSVWAREVLAAAAYGLIRLTDVQRDATLPGPHPARFLALQATQAARADTDGACVHPPGAIRELPFTDVCSLCSAVVRVR